MMSRVLHPGKSSGSTNVRANEEPPAQVERRPFVDKVPHTASLGGDRSAYSGDTPSPQLPRLLIVGPRHLDLIGAEKPVLECLYEP